ncbi:hypothetical protein cce_4323 [Crocosphaera subtropica ATCC 51142]|uniref:NACHT domain-containing protein n=1 Tax=Crocosphaera subtropica (strain ATCC 51142 / BH68) TaxID=43989 RepID=B1WTF6_CROS5|nr:NACHT domain-containing protein [Crocosphaera subtropica]ACB53671.1 hypothetical protein cce_4323 [Crocosphaera subtropica ATCC 51142]
MTFSWDSFLCTIAVDYELSSGQSKIFRCRFSEIYRHLSESEFYEIAETELQTTKETYKKQLTEIYKKLEKRCEKLTEKKADKSKILISWLKQEYSSRIIQPIMDWETVCLQMLEVNSESLNSKEIYISPHLSNNDNLINREAFYESQMLEGQSKCLLLGEKGIGKSSFLYQFGLWILKNKKGYPIYLSLEKLKNKSITYYLIEDWLREAHSFFPHIVLSSEHLLNLFKQGNVWLLIDGLANNKRSIKLLDTLFKGWIGEANIFAGCQSRIIDNKNFPSSRFQTYYLTLFNEQQVKAFINEWFINEQTELGEKLWQNLTQEQYSSLRELVKHPQNLSDLCSSWETKHTQPSMSQSNNTIPQGFSLSFIYWKVRFLFSSPQNTDANRLLQSSQPEVEDI